MDNHPTHEALLQKIAELEEKINTLLLAEKRLQEDLERYRILADFTFDWEYWVSQDGDYIYVSPSCERVTGYSPDQLRHNPGLLEKMTHIDDRGIISAHISREMEKQEDMSFEFRIVTKQGDEKWIAHVCRPVFGPRGNFMGRRAVNRDITDHRQLKRPSGRVKRDIKACLSIQ